jgi:hypothetical protein
VTKTSFIDTLALVRNLGLLVNQVAMYGIAHKVIREQAISFFNRLKTAVAAHETIEFAIAGEKLSVNGETRGIDPMSARNLREKMLLHKLPGIYFSSALTQEEFLTFISFLGKPPGKIQELGGFEEVLKQTGIKGVSLVHFIYKRVSTSDPGKEPEPRPPPVKRPRRKPKPKDDAPAEGQDGHSPVVAPAQDVSTQVRLRRKRFHSELKELLAAVSQLVNGEVADQDTKVVDLLRAIRNTLQTSTERSKERIAILLGHEKTPGGTTGAPSRTRAKKKKPPKLSYPEYMSRFAELIQEIIQPLTVTNGVIEILRQKQVGPVNKSQAQFLDLALESVNRVNQLVRHIRSLYGEPESFTPDQTIISETYR